MYWVKHSADDIFNISFLFYFFFILFYFYLFIFGENKQWRFMESLFSGEKKKSIISLSSAELAQRMVKVKVSITTEADDSLIFF